MFIWYGYPIQLPRIVSISYKMYQYYLINCHIIIIDLVKTFFFYFFFGIWKYPYIQKKYISPETCVVSDRQECNLSSVKDELYLSIVSRVYPAIKFKAKWADISAEFFTYKNWT